MKILESEIRREIRRELCRESLLVEKVFKSGDGVNIKGIDVDGVVRASHGMHMLVHWLGKDALKKIPKKKQIKNFSELSYIRKGEVQKGWSWDTVKIIIDRHPAKGFFTIETPSTLESQSLTGVNAKGKSTGIVSGGDVGIVIDTISSGVAFVADFFPGPGTALSTSIGVTQALSAISKAAWLAAGLSLIALIPVMGDAWKAAFPWMKWLARLEKAKTITLSATAIALLTDMVTNWDKYRSGFKEMVGKATHGSKVSVEIADTSFDKIIAAVDKAVDEIRDILPEQAVTAENIQLTRGELRTIVQKVLDEGKPASKSTGKPYKGSRRGKTESQAQQMAAGIALRAREEGSKESAIRKLKGAPKEMAKMSMKDLRKLATIRRGSEVPDSTKKGHERAALPGHIKKGKK